MERQIQEGPGGAGSAGSCLSCARLVAEAESYQRYKVCPFCGYHFGVPARERIGQLVDPNSFRESHRFLASVDPLRFTDRLSYRARVKEAQRKTGLADAVVIGTARIDGHACALAVLDFQFLGGSMGSVMGEKITLAFELAAKRRLPLVAVVTSGGARMQEGLLSLMQMAKTAAATRQLYRAGLLYIAVLANPTTGGTYASWASLADILVAEPGALIGFAGPRVAEQAGVGAGEECRTAENLFHHGMLDQIVERPRLRGFMATCLELARSPFRLTALGREHSEGVALAAEEGRTPWDRVQLARHPQRPTALYYIERMFPSFVELHGDRLYGDDPAVVCGLAEIGGEAVTVVGLERGTGEAAAERNFGRASPEGYRKALRVMRLGARLGLPIITLIDTPGALADSGAEERGLAGALAECLASMAELPTPIVSVIIGEGGSGGALALGVADRVLMLENAVYSVIAPEGAAAILYSDPSRAEELTPQLKVTAPDVESLGIIDAIVPEPPGGAHQDPEEAARLLRRALLRELVAVQGIPTKRLLKERQRRFRGMGQVASVYRTAITSELEELRGYLHRALEHVRDFLPRRSGQAGGQTPAEKDD